MERKNKREWVIKATFPNGTVECGSPLTKARADSSAKKMNRDYPFIKHEVVLADLVSKTEEVNEVAASYPQKENGMYPFLIQIEEKAGRPLTDQEKMAALAVFYQDKTEKLLELLGEARQAIGWYLGLCNGFEAGETYVEYPDLDAYSYLKMEAWSIGERIDAAIAAANGTSS